MLGINSVKGLGFSGLGLVPWLENFIEAARPGCLKGVRFRPRLFALRFLAQALPRPKDNPRSHIRTPTPTLTQPNPQSPLPST